MTKERFEYLDIARGLGILLVVWGHIATHWTGSLAYTFHMPLFFIISGMLFNPDRHSNFKSFFIKRSKRLLIPYAIYSVATWLIWVCFNIATGKTVGNYWYPLLQTIVAQGSGQFFWHNSPLWFIPCLLAVEIMYYFMARKKDWIILFISFLIAGLNIVLEHLFNDEYLLLLPWNLDAAMMALPFYSTSNIIMRHITHQQINGWISCHKILSAFFVIASFTTLALSLKWFNSPSMGHSYYGNEWVFHIRAFLGSASLIVLSAFITFMDVSTLFAKLNQFFKWVGKVSLDVMCTHVPIKGIIIAVLALATHIPQDSLRLSLFWSLIAFLATVIIDLVIVFFIKNVTALKSRK